MADHHIPVHHDAPVHHDLPVHHEPPVHHEAPTPTHDHTHHQEDNSGHHSHNNGHQHNHHEHGHGHRHGQGHGHHEHHKHGRHGHGGGDGSGPGNDAGAPGHQHKDEWSGDEYLNYPGLAELAKFSHETVLYALRSARYSIKDIKRMNLLEVGCGAGAVTKLLSGSFASVHAIDVSPSMLATFSSQLPSDQYPTVTHSHHTLSSTSGQQFKSGEPVPSPTKAEPKREVKLPRDQFDVAVVNLVLHHVDDVEGFMAGLKDLLVEGGTVVFTEFTNLKFHRTETQDGSVNAPAHYHDEYDEGSISKLLSTYGWQDVYTEVRGKMSIWRNDKFHDVDCLIARAKKASKKE